ncbi:MAG: hypothetical protein IJU54_01930 [Alphaproteobacteria bacterium]|nr:hypothetical protein [Alphaproteobacteria bacterium]
MDENKIMKSEKKNEHIIGNNNSVNIENNKLDNDKQIINQNSNVKQTIELDENNNINMTDKINNPLFNKKINNKILGLSFFDFYKRCGNKGNAIHKDIKQIFLDHPLFFSDYPGVTIYNYEKNKKAKQRMKELYKCYEKAIKQVLLSNNIQSSSAKYFKKG